MQTIAARDFFRHRRVLVVGLGLHGGAASAVRWLYRQGAKVRVQDMKTANELKPTLQKLKRLRVTWHLGGHSLDDVKWAEFVYINQGVPDTNPVVRRARQLGRPLLNETTIFFERCPCPIIGITGTRGKSTTTLLLGHILSAARRRSVVSGNVRQAMMLDVLDRLRPNMTAVLELSSFQLEYLPLVRRSPHVAVMTNLMVDHLNRYNGMNEYSQAKKNIFRYQRSDDIAIVNAQNRWTRQAVASTPATIWWFQTSGQRGQDGLTVRADWVIEYHRGTTRRLFPVADVQLRGRHNLENILAAVAVARSLNVTAAQIHRAIKTFTGVPSRQETIRTWRGHDFVNDTTATTPDGTIAALDVFPQAIFIVGGTDKRLKFSTLAKKLLVSRIRIVFLPGTGTTKLLAALRRQGDRRQHHIALSMKDAVQQAIRLSRPKQTIVLSPGAASFGLFVHEFHRGDEFTRAVRELR